MGQAPVFLVSLHRLQVGAATVFHFFQCLAPARVCLPVWERFGQCLQPSRLLGHCLLQLCPKQQGFMGWGRPQGPREKDGQEDQLGPTESTRSPSRPRQEDSLHHPHSPSLCSTSLLVGWGGGAGLSGPLPLTTSAICKGARSGRALKVLFSCQNKGSCASCSPPGCPSLGTPTSPGRQGGHPA